MWKRTLVVLGILCFVMLSMGALSRARVLKTIFDENFESGLGSWQIDNGIWELCLHDPPDTMGFFYVTTICGGNYPDNTDSRLVSPPIDLTQEQISGDEEIHLDFRQHFYYGDDGGYVQISEDDGATWRTLQPSYPYSSEWTRSAIDITAYAGKTIRIAFYHTADDRYTYPGWAIDNVRILKMDPDPPPYTFEGGWGDWYADNGIWNLGLPSSGPPNAYEGLHCAGTVLSGNYQDHTDSRLVSPSFKVDEATGDQEVHLRFRQWFYYGDDYGDLQIKVYDDATKTWSEWEYLPDSDDTHHYSTAAWTPRDVDITPYQGKKIRIAFFHIADDRYNYPGWFVDKLEMITKVPEPALDFECGWDGWSASNGVWEIGPPLSGPTHAYSGDKCAGTVLTGNYPDYTDSRLLSPTMDLSRFSPGEIIALTFMHWYGYGDDYGEVWIQFYDDAAKTWEWETNKRATVSGTSGGWTQHPPIDLSTYAGKKIRLGFQHMADDRYPHPGWYIDHIRIKGSGFTHFCDCDTNRDRVCDMMDWVAFGADWGRNDCGTPPGSGALPNDCKCDLNKDGTCDMLDWIRFGEDWGNFDCLTCD